MNTPQLTIVFFVLLISQSCRPLYVPNIHNVPLLKEKKDVSITLSPNDLQGAYAVSDNIGIMLNLYRNNVNQAFDFEEDVSRSFCDFGVGYFKEFGKFGVFEIYGGYGIGGLKFEESGGARNYYSASTSKFFVQPNLAFSYKIVDFVFSTRLVSLNLNNPDLTRYGGRNVFETDLSEVHEYSHQFIEPGVTLKIGWKQVKVFWQTILTIPLQEKNNIVESVPMMYLGVHLNFSKRLKDDIPKRLID